MVWTPAQSRALEQSVQSLGYHKTAEFFQSQYDADKLTLTQATLAFKILRVRYEQEYSRNPPPYLWLK